MSYISVMVDPTTKTILYIHIVLTGSPNATIFPAIFPAIIPAIFPAIIPPSDGTATTSTVHSASPSLTSLCLSSTQTPPYGCRSTPTTSLLPAFTSSPTPATDGTQSTVHGHGSYKPSDSTSTQSSTTGCSRDYVCSRSSTSNNVGCVIYIIDFANSCVVSC